MAMKTDGPPGAPLNPYSPPAVAIDAAAYQPVASTRTFNSTMPLAKAITLIFGIHVVVELLADVNAFVTIDVMGRVLASAPYEESELSAIDTRNMALAVLSGVVAILGVVWFCMFMVRANRNARSFGSPMSFRPGWAAGYFFVPILMLWKPYQAMKEIWQGSDPDPNAQPFSVRVSSLIGWWWALYLLHNVGGRLVWQVNKNLNGPKDFINAAWTELLTSGLTIGAALLAIAVVRAVARRQDERQTRQHGVAAVL
jgi:Domain of unknown function (DUF4328)